MAGIGSAWGSREEMLHPRDRHGRFRKKWSMAKGVVDALTGFLDRFQPRSFQSDGQAAQYTFNNRKGSWGQDEIRRLHMDWDEANETLQAGEMDPTTQRFVDQMDRHMVETTDDLIMSQTVPPEAFGLNAQQAALEDGGLEDFIGLEIADAGYTAMNIGSELSHPPGSVTLRVAVPKGTRAAFGGRSPNDRGVFLDRDQPLVVTKVEPDGRGGWYVLAIAGSGKRTQGATAVAGDRTFGRRGAGLTPEQREARITTPPFTPKQRRQIGMQGEREAQQETLRGIQARGEQVSAPAPEQAPAPAAPASPQTPAPPAAGVPERREPVQSESIGPGSPEGKSPSDIATDADAAAKAQAEAPPPPPAPPTPMEFREASRDLPVPSAGAQRREWNNAHQAMTSGKRDPGDVLRELDSDIETNKGRVSHLPDQAKKDELERNIQAQEQLADLISERYGVPRRSTSAPVAKKSPAPTPGAPSTKREATPKAPAPKKAAKRVPQDVADQMKSVKTREEGDALLQDLTGPELHAVAEAAGIAVPKRATKDKLRQTIGQHGYGRRLDSDAVSGNGRRMRGDTTTDNERRLIESAKKYRGKERNSEEERIVAEADRILAERGEAPPPAKAVPEVSAEDEAFKARVAEAGLPDKVTELRAMAREQKIRGFSTMNKKQLQSALLGDEVPRAGKIAPVTPKKLVPHLKAAKSDQEARGLLENHTLADLRAMAKDDEVGVTLPSRGVTKDKAKDAILEAIRGVPEGGKGETPARSLREELDAQGWVEPTDTELADKVRGMVSGTDEMDAADLRNTRDALEAMVKTERGKGNRQDANLVQTLADTMGMRAQVISGVEEGPARAPVKRVAKKAVPAVPEGGEVPEVERPLEKMLKPELLALAQKEGASSVRPSWSKAKILDEIKKNRRMDSSRGRETDEERLRRELGSVPGGAERDLGPAQGPLQLPDRAPILEEAVPETPPVKKVAKRAAKKAVDQAADTISGQLKETFGDQLRQEDPDSVRDSVRAVGLEPRGNTSEEIFDNALKDMLENRMRELGMLPEDPKKPTRAQKRVPKGSVKGPKADVPITTEGRRSSFTEAWDDQGFVDDPSLNEIRNRVASGDLTHEEGVRRIESEISFNEEEISDLGAELRGMSPEDRDPESGTADGIHARRAELQDKITSQKKAAKFLRNYSRNEAPVTQEELESKLDGAEKAALQRVEVDDLKAAAKAEGLGDIEGDDKDTVVQNIAKKMAARELANRQKEQAAQDRQARIDEVRGVSDNLSQLEQMAQNGGSDKALATAIRRLPKADQAKFSGDKEHFWEELDDVLRSHGLSRVGEHGATIPYDPEKHEGVDLPKGAPVYVSRVGHSLDLGNGDKVFFKAHVLGSEPSAPEAPAAPSGSQTGEQILSHREARLAKLADPQKKTVSASRLQPGERLRVAQTEDGRWHSTAKKTGSKEITVTRVEKASGNDYVIHGRDDDGNDITLGSLFGQNVVHRAGPAAPPKATKKAAKAAEPDLTRDMEVLQQGRRVDNPEGVAERAEARKVAKAAVPAKANPKPVVDLDNPTRHDADVIGTGLDIDRKGEDRQWMDVVQSELDRGIDGRQIADGLRREADAQRTIHNIQETVGGTEGASPAARINRMELMADRLEGVRPIKKAAPPAPAKAATGPAKKDVDTMAAARAQSDALFDLRNGKSPSEVATKLRQQATQVGSRDHDVETVRPLEFTPAEKSSMKRSDAKKLRELAAEIQAQGVAQRAEARAAKKAAPKKARPSASDDAVATLLMDRIAERDPAVAKAVLAEISPEDRKELDAARERDTARKAAKAAAPKKRTAAELKRARTAAEMNGISVEEQLERFDQQKLERKTLTGPVGEVIKAQLDDAMRRLQEANTEAEERSALAGLLRPELAQLAQRLGLKPDRAKSIMINEIRDRVKGREAPGASAERAVPKVEAPGGVTSQPKKTQHWGGRPQPGQHYMHGDGIIPQAMDRLGDDAQIDVGNGDSLYNRVGDIATDIVGGRLTPQDAVDRLRSLAGTLPEGSTARRKVESMADDIDVPKTPMPELPSTVPPVISDWLERMNADFPVARAQGRYAANTFQKSLMEKIAERLRAIASGQGSTVGADRDLAAEISRHAHESVEGSVAMGRLAGLLNDGGSKLSEAWDAWMKQIRADRKR